MFRLPTAIALHGVAAFAASAAVTPWIRECNLDAANDPAVLAAFPKFLSWLETQSDITVAPTMGRAVVNTTIDGICLAIGLTDYSCDFPITVTGKGLAYTAEATMKGCNGIVRDDGRLQGPFGWAYYVDPVTGNGFHGQMWAYTSRCGSWYPKSACTRMWCKNPQTGDPPHDPRVPCPEEINATAAEVQPRTVVSSTIQERDEGKVKEEVAAVLEEGPFKEADTTPATVPIRECYYDYAGNTSMLATIDKFATWLEDQPMRNMLPGLSRAVFRQTVDGQCLQLQVLNWDCTFPLQITGSGLAYTARGIAQQCNATRGPSGWGYYTQPETGNTFHNELWSILQPCTDGYPKSACGILICPSDPTTSERHDPSLPCPEE